MAEEIDRPGGVVPDRIVVEAFVLIVVPRDRPFFLTAAFHLRPALYLEDVRWVGPPDPPGFRRPVRQSPNQLTDIADESPRRAVDSVRVGRLGSRSEQGGERTRMCLSPRPALGLDPGKPRNRAVEHPAFIDRLRGAHGARFAKMSAQRAAETQR